MTQDTRPPVGSTGTLQIESGKFYRDRDGRKVGPMKQSGSPRWPWIAVEGDGFCWNNDGTAVENTKSVDLIAEWRDDQPAHIIHHNGREYDLTALEAPLGLLPDPVVYALKAWPHGLEYWVTDGVWHETYTVDGSTLVHRANPAPVETRVPCQRGLAAFRSDMEFGTCIKRADGSLDWDTWEPSE